MFVTSDQIFIFILCVFIGSIIGGVYSIFSVMKFIFKNIFLKNLVDFLFAIISAFIFIFLSYEFSLPSFRIYMLLGLFFGFYLYLKSFYIILAKWIKKLYNIVSKNIFVKITLKRRKNKDGKIKGRKTNSCRNGGRGIACCDTCFGLSISNNKHKRKKQASG